VLPFPAFLLWDWFRTNRAPKPVKQL
jgi:hypothetical protein